MNLKEIKEIINLMNDNELSEIEVEREGSKIKIKKNSNGVIESFVQPSIVQQPSSSKSTKESEPQVPEAPAPLVSSEVIVSPMVGTFYRAPSPEAPPFIELGQVVEVGQVVCIVEAMKLMNEIKAEIRGKVVEIAAENAEPVEFGQMLFRIEPA